MFPRSQCKRNLLAAPDVVVDRISGQCLALKVVHVRTTPAVQLDIYLLGQGSWSDRVSVSRAPRGHSAGIAQLQLRADQTRISVTGQGFPSHCANFWASAAEKDLLRERMANKCWLDTARAAG